MRRQTHQLDNLPLDLVHGGALDDNGIVRLPVDAKRSQKCFCYEAKKKRAIDEMT